MWRKKHKYRRGRSLPSSHSIIIIFDNTFTILFSKYSQYYVVLFPRHLLLRSLSKTSGGWLIYFGVGVVSWNLEAGFFQVLLWSLTYSYYKKGVLGMSK